MPHASYIKKELTIRVAEGIGNDLQADLSFLWRGHDDGLSDQGLAHFPGDGGFALNGFAFELRHCYCLVLDDER